MPDRILTYKRIGIRLAAVAVVGLLVAGCAKADKKEEASTSAATSATSTSTTSSAMAGMQMSTGSSGSSGSTGSSGASGVAAMSVNGIKPIPTQVLASTTWEGMKITAQAMTAVPFVVYNGTKE